MKFNFKHEIVEITTLSELRALRRRIAEEVDRKLCGYTGYNTELYLSELPALRELCGLAVSLDKMAPELEAKEMFSEASSWAKAVLAERD